MMIACRREREVDLGLVVENGRSDLIGFVLGCLLRLLWDLLGFSSGVIFIPVGVFVENLWDLFGS